MLPLDSIYATPLVPLLRGYNLELITITQIFGLKKNEGFFSSVNFLDIPFLNLCKPSGGRKILQL